MANGQITWLERAIVPAIALVAITVGQFQVNAAKDVAVDTKALVNGLEPRVQQLESDVNRTESNVDELDGRVQLQDGQIDSLVDTLARFFRHNARPTNAGG